MFDKAFSAKSEKANLKIPLKLNNWTWKYFTLV